MWFPNRNCVLFTNLFPRWLLCMLDFFFQTTVFAKNLCPEQDRNRNMKSGFPLAYFAIRNLLQPQESRPLTTKMAWLTSKKTVFLVQMYTKSETRFHMIGNKTFEKKILRKAWLSKVFSKVRRGGFKEEGCCCMVIATPEAKWMPWEGSGIFVVYAHVFRNWMNKCFRLQAKYIAISSHSPQWVPVCYICKLSAAFCLVSHFLICSRVWRRQILIIPNLGCSFCSLQSNKTVFVVPPGYPNPSSIDGGWVSEAPKNDLTNKETLLKVLKTIISILLKPFFEQREYITDPDLELIWWNDNNIETCHNCKNFCQKTLIVHLQIIQCQV